MVQRAPAKVIQRRWQWLMFDAFQPTALPIENPRPSPPQNHALRLALIGSDPARRRGRHESLDGLLINL